MGLPSGYSNPRTVDQAIAWAKAQAKNPTENWHDYCLWFVSEAYGYGYAGYNTAYDQYTALKNEGKITTGDVSSAPAGALMFFKGSNPDGHVALSLGNGMVATNDSGSSIEIVPASTITKGWGYQYLGWSAPYMQKAGGTGDK